MSRQCRSTSMPVNKYEQCRSAGNQIIKMVKGYSILNKNVNNPADGHRNVFSVQGIVPIILQDTD